MNNKYYLSAVLTIIIRDCITKITNGHLRQTEASTKVKAAPEPGQF